MVLLAPADFERPINLLDEQQTNHLMRKGHLRKAQRHVSTLAQRISIAKRAADNERNMAAACQRQRVQLRCQLRAGQLLADDI